MSAPATILDMCCGSRMFWFDKSDERAIFVTNGAIVIHTQRLKSDPGGNLLS
ncbi:hypothetical protein OSK45_26870 [Escherichia coli]|nr:hypothetical protein [Escherichia coli]